MCDFCNTFDFGRIKCHIDKYGSTIWMSGGSDRFPVEEQFKFCPECGTPMSEIIATRKRGENCEAQL